MKNTNTRSHKENRWNRNRDKWSPLHIVPSWQQPPRCFKYASRITSPDGSFGSHHKQSSKATARSDVPNFFHRHLLRVCSRRPAHVEAKRPDADSLYHSSATEQSQAHAGWTDESLPRGHLPRNKEAEIPWTAFRLLNRSTSHHHRDPSSDPVPSLRAQTHVAVNRVLRWTVLYFCTVGKHRGARLREHVSLTCWVTFAFFVFR